MITICGLLDALYLQAGQPCTSRTILLRPAIRRTCRGRPRLLPDAGRIRTDTPVLQVHFGAGSGRRSRHDQQAPRMTSLFTVTSHEVARQMLTDNARFSSSGTRRPSGRSWGGPSCRWTRPSTSATAPADVGALEPDRVAVQVVRDDLQLAAGGGRVEDTRSGSSRNRPVPRRNTRP
jgi:hypothetical protein